MRRPLALGLTMLVAAGCGLSGGGAHSDLILDIQNHTASRVVLRWVGARHTGSTFVGGCASTRQGLDADDYAISLEGSSTPPVDVRVPFAQDPPTRWIVIKADGSVDGDAGPQPSDSTFC